MFILINIEILKFLKYLFCYAVWFYFSCTVFIRVFLFVLDSLFSFNFLFSLTNNVYFSLLPFIPIKFQIRDLLWLNKKISNLKFKLQKSNFLFFSRKIYFTRYLNHFLLGFVSSKLFVYKIKFKLYNFLKGNLFFQRFSSDLVRSNEAVLNFLII